MGQIEKEQLEYFKILKENTDRMLSLISDLLMVSKIQSADLPLEKETFSLKERISQMVEEFKAFSRASNVEIEIEAEKDMPKVFGDPKKIDLVVENLIDNAIRYTSDGGKISLRLSTKKNKVLFEIEDEGVGIPKEDQKYIFQKFFRASNASKERTDGSGLGLYIVKSIVEKSGGKIWFDSKEGEGTTFFFTLPTSKKK
jgi:signal transduction histidine kinase